MYKRYIKNVSLKILFVIFTVYSFCLTAYADGDSCISGLEVEYTIPESSFTHKVKLWREEFFENNPGEVTDIYYLSLPYGAKGRDVAIHYPVEYDIAIDNITLSNGKFNLRLAEGQHTLDCNGQEYIIYVFYLSDIPTVYLDVDTDIEDFNKRKEVKTTGNIAIVNDGILEYEGPLEYMKGRGNSTWWDKDKKPYNIKLEKKANLFDMGSAKKYILLADAYDDTRLKSKIAYDLAQAVGVEYTSDAVNVNLFVNNEYYGKYTFTEKVETDKNRVEILDMDGIIKDMNPELENLADVIEKSNPDITSYTPNVYLWADVENKPKTTDGGFLLELDFAVRYDNNQCGFVSDYGQYVAINSPEFATKEQVEYIRGFYQELEDALLSDDGYNKNGKHYSEYIDVESFAKIYVYNEFSRNLDGGISSFYLYKDVDGKLFAGPVWDMDSSFGKIGSFNGRDVSQPEGIAMTDAKDYTNPSVYSLLALCCKHSDFRNIAAVQWNECFLPYVCKMTEDIQNMSAALENDIVSDLIRYSEVRTDSIQSVREAYVTDIENLKDFIAKRIEYMSRYYDKDTHFVQYCSNGGQGIMIDVNTYLKNNTATVSECVFEYDDIEFIGWNTKYDGSGKWYYPEDSIVMDDSDVYLFAQWQGQTGVEYKPAPQKNLTILQRIAEYIKSVF